MNLLLIEGWTVSQVKDFAYDVIDQEWNMATVKTNCHACNAPVMIRILEQETGPPPAKVIVRMRPVPPARDCEACGDVTCVNCPDTDCPTPNGEID